MARVCAQDVAAASLRRDSRDRAGRRERARDQRVLPRYLRVRLLADALCRACEPRRSAASLGAHRCAGRWHRRHAHTGRARTRAARHRRQRCRLSGDGRDAFRSAHRRCDCRRCARHRYRLVAATRLLRCEAESRARRRAHSPRCLRSGVRFRDRHGGTPRRRRAAASVERIACAPCAADRCGVARIRSETRGRARRKGRAMRGGRGSVVFVAALAALAACQREARDFDAPTKSVTAPPVRMSAIQPGAISTRTTLEHKYEENAYALSEGKRLFGWYNCNGCHANGGGDKGPALMDNVWVYGSDPANIYATIAEGRPNGMPSFGGHIPDNEVWELVAYVRSLSGLAS